jgi:hypothetical protein
MCITSIPTCTLSALLQLFTCSKRFTCSALVHLFTTCSLLYLFICSLLQHMFTCSGLVHLFKTHCTSTIVDIAPNTHHHCVKYGFMLKKLMEDAMAGVLPETSFVCPFEIGQPSFRLLQAVIGSCRLVSNPSSFFKVFEVVAVKGKSTCMHRLSEPLRHHFLRFTVF